jgi:hypothetical protein
MTTMREIPAVLSLAVLCLVGCGPASTKEENWAYTGSDAALRQPTFGPQGSLSPADRHLQVQQSTEAWRKKSGEAVDSAKDACARETGGSGTRNSLTGYSDAFMACMKARGWIRVGNPG